MLLQLEQPFNIGEAKQFRSSDQRGSKSFGTRYKNSSLTEWHDTKEEIMGDSGQIATIKRSMLV